MTNPIPSLDEDNADRDRTIRIYEERTSKTSLLNAAVAPETSEESQQLVATSNLHRTSPLVPFSPWLRQIVLRMTCSKLVAFDSEDDSDGDYDGFDNEEGEELQHETEKEPKRQTRSKYMKGRVFKSKLDDLIKAQL